MDIMRIFEQKHGETQQESDFEADCPEVPEAVDSKNIVSAPTAGERKSRITKQAEDLHKEFKAEGTYTALPMPNWPESLDQEKELVELKAKLKTHQRHVIESARNQDVPLKALIHIAALFLSDDIDDWMAANDTIYSFTSPFGLRQLQYPKQEG